MKKILILLAFIPFVMAGNSALALTRDVSIEGQLDATGNMSAASFFGNGSNITSLDAGQVASGTMPDARLSSNVVTPDAIQAFTSKTITAASNTVAANSLKSATTIVSVDAAAAPIAGQYLRASGGTAAGWQIPATSETTAGTTASLTTTANQRVVVWVKGDVIPGTTAQTITVAYNSVTKAIWLTSAAAATTRFPFAIMYTEVPGAGTYNITVTTTGGTMANIKITVLKLNL